MRSGRGLILTQRMVFFFKEPRIGIPVIPLLLEFPKSTDDLPATVDRIGTGGHGSYVSNSDENFAAPLRLVYVHWPTTDLDLKPQYANVGAH